MTAGVVELPWTSEVRARLAGTAVYLPERWVSMEEREAEIAAASGSFRPPAGLVTRLTGVKGVYMAARNEQPSDLAASAARTVLTDTGTRPSDIDLVIFAACSQDMTEPATAHIVADKLGVSCPVFDVKNACNSVLNALELTQALISGRQYRTVLVTCGELPSVSVRYRVPDAAAFARAFPSYGFSDAGAAMLFTAGAAGPSSAGILRCRFAADSSVWPAATVRYGGAASVRDPDEEDRYFRMEGTRLQASLRAQGPLLHAWLEEWGLTLTDFAFIGVHQVAFSDIEALCAEAGVPRDRFVVTLPDHGNVAAASLPLQLFHAVETGKAKQGDLIALTGAAAGSSGGLAVMRL
ncbi:3-oxoacyl-ACP synthase III family protein [Streptomyces sp. MMG1121]|uniref:3-oxoacyl-ACP synthase III family protein n=1 Tax=Streptomyces sp. MMG1121 TaxID=1415544 RepID=UPI0006ADAB4B|nr:3-oxoacyl-[acyl-carrier-protein] synthase III C-terminal domain-containing protein [Streptomyces sp. MMG1121]KOV57977.1 3-oxoacyl-ACP synthase [Streptomyces sp. MMG1121]